MLYRRPRPPVASWVCLGLCLPVWRAGAKTRASPVGSEAFCLEASYVDFVAGAANSPGPSASLAYDIAAQGQELPPLALLPPPPPPPPPPPQSATSKTPRQVVSKNTERLLTRSAPSQLLCWLLEWVSLGQMGLEIFWHLCVFFPTRTLTWTNLSVFNKVI